MDYLDWIIWKAVALCVLAFCYGLSHSRGGVDCNAASALSACVGSGE
jgi:hypothetical protein